MIKLFTALATGGVIALASVAASSTADARCLRCGVGAGVVGGIAAGAIIAGAARNSVYGPAYDYNSGYGYAPGYDPGYAYGPRTYYGSDYGYGYATSDYAHGSRDMAGAR